MAFKARSVALSWPGKVGQPYNFRAHRGNAAAANEVIPPQSGAIGVPNLSNGGRGGNAINNAALFASSDAESLGIISWK